VGATIDYTWFIKRGIVSLLLDTENGDSVEVAMAGPDSVIGFLEIVTKNEALFRAQVQIAGEALRISARDLQAAIKHLPEIGVAPHPAPPICGRVIEKHRVRHTRRIGLLQERFVPFGCSQLLDRTGDRLWARRGRGDRAGVLGKAFPDFFDALIL